MSYRIVTDATADLTTELLKGLPEVVVISMEILVGEEAFRYGPDGTITSEDFYQKLRSGLFASTTQVNPTAYRAVFEQELKLERDVLYLGFTSGMSGMFQNALCAAEQIQEDYPERKILCIDTRCAAIGQGLLVREAAKKQQNGTGIEELSSWVQDYSMAACHWFTVDTFEHLRHGGRVSAATAALGTALQIKPLLRVSTAGVLEVMDKPRGHKRAMRALLARMESGWMPQISPTVIVGHGDCMAYAQELSGEILQKFPGAEVFIVPIGPVIGAHTGPGMLALTFWGTAR